MRRRRLVLVSLVVALVSILLGWAVFPRPSALLARYDAVTFGRTPDEVEAVLGRPPTKDEQNAAWARLTLRSAQGDAFVIVNVKEDWMEEGRGEPVVWAEGVDCLTVYFRDGLVVGKVFSTVQRPSFLHRVMRFIGW